MWWNILPSWFITGGCVYIPVVTMCVSSYIYVGSIHGRDREQGLQSYHLFRDQKLLGGANPYRQHKHLGLDTLED